MRARYAVSVLVITFDLPAVDRDLLLGALQGAVPIQNVYLDVVQVQEVLPAETKHQARVHCEKSTLQKEMQGVEQPSELRFFFTNKSIILHSDPKKAFVWKFSLVLRVWMQSWVWARWLKSLGTCRHTMSLGLGCHAYMALCRGVVFFGGVLSTITTPKRKIRTTTGSQSAA